jgi:hypothetical protein
MLPNFRIVMLTALSPGRVSEEERRLQHVWNPAHGHVRICLGVLPANSEESKFQKEELTTFFLYIRVRKRYTRRCNRGILLSSQGNA